MIIAKRPDRLRPLTTTMNFRRVTTPNDQSITAINISECHQCWGVHGQQPSLNLRRALAVALFEIDKLVCPGDEGDDVEFADGGLLCR